MTTTFETPVHGEKQTRHCGCIYVYVRGTKFSDWVVEKMCPDHA